MTDAADLVDIVDVGARYRRDGFVSPVRVLDARYRTPRCRPMLHDRDTAITTNDESAGDG